MNTWRRITAPSDRDAVSSLKAGDGVLISGIIYAARDKAHQRLCSLILEGKPLPFDPAGQFIYYVGPTPTPPGKVTGSAGPTTSYRMDPFSDIILKTGICGMIGKGKRDLNTRKLIQEYRVPYFSAFGGAGAYLGKRITSSEIIAFPELGPEAVYRFRVEDFPAVVIDDVYGQDLYENQLRK